MLCFPEVEEPVDQVPHRQDLPQQDSREAGKHQEEPIQRHHTMWALLRDFLKRFPHYGYNSASAKHEQIWMKVPCGLHEFWCKYDYITINNTHTVPKWMFCIWLPLIIFGIHDKICWIFEIIHVVYVLIIYSYLDFYFISISTYCWFLSKIYKTQQTTRWTCFRY